MTRLLVILALSLLGSSSVFATCTTSNCANVQQTPDGKIVASANTNTTSQSQSTNSGQGNGNSITYNQSGNQAYSGGYKIATVPGVAAPGLTTTLSETCMGSTTAGVAIMGLGVSGGTTWKDEECVRRLNARELAQTLGERDAAKELLCGNQEIWAVYKSLGRPCLMNPSYSTAIPGGALKNYRDPVTPKPSLPLNSPVQQSQIVIQAAPTPRTNLRPGG